jgi:lipopolysaccharide/colanic/teichoic acid biosynthesis glycosyltransferase
MYRHFFKRVIDFVVALLALVCLSPLLLVVTIWLHFANKGAGAFFLQPRPGKDGKIFRVVKFKTMTDERDEKGELLPDEQRLTKVGRFVRSTSIDELPQFVNVLKGDMSLVGPRPPVTYHPYPGYDNYPEWAKKRFTMRPGMTGLVQVSTRSMASWDDRMKIDLEYIEKFNILFDIQILFGTIGTVLGGVKSSK